jgi:SAM-dependent methyltransferase
MDSSPGTHTVSSKYARIGAYHWIEADPRWTNLKYNVPLVARYQAILDHVPQRSRAILDVGCGDGYLIHLLHRRGFRGLVGMDNDALAVQLARDRLLENNGAAACYVSIASVYNLPFPASSFDSVVMADVIEHLDAQEKALSEVSRVTTEQGTLILSTPNWQPDRRWDTSHIIEYRPDELEALLSRFFGQVTLYGCWPMWCFNLWARGPIWRLLLRYLARLGFNPFALSTREVSLGYGQLIAVCSR